MGCGSSSPKPVKQNQKKSTTSPSGTTTGTGPNASKGDKQDETSNSQINVQIDPKTSGDHVQDGGQGAQTNTDNTGVNDNGSGVPAEQTNQDGEIQTAENSPSESQEKQNADNSKAGNNSTQSPINQNGSNKNMGGKSPRGDGTKGRANTSHGFASKNARQTGTASSKAYPSARTNGQFQNSRAKTMPGRGRQQQQQRLSDEMLTDPAYRRKVLAETSERLKTKESQSPRDGNTDEDQNQNPSAEHNGDIDGDNSDDNGQNNNHGDMSNDESSDRKRTAKQQQYVPYYGDPNERAKAKRIRFMLREAMINNDLDELDEAIYLFETSDMVDLGDLTDAINRMEILQLKKDLQEAIKRRNLGILNRAIGDTYSTKHDKDLRHLLDRAEELRDHLDALNHYTHDILEMDHNLISEIRSYCSPPPSVHEVMAACYMLLGIREERLLEWSEVQAHVGRTGQAGLKKMIQSFDPDRVPVHTVLRVKEILNFYNLQDVRVASNGAASFYIWAKNMVDLVDKRRLQNSKEDQERAKSSAKKG